MDKSPKLKRKHNLKRKSYQIRNPRFKTMTKVQNQTKSKIKIQNDKSKFKMNKIILHFRLSF